MQSPQRSRLLMAAILSVAISCGATISNRCLAADTVDPANLIPDTAVVYFEISQPDAILDRLLDPQLANLLNESPQYQAYTESAQYQHINAVVQLLEQRLQIKWPEAARQLAGNTYLAIDAKTQATLLIVKPKNSELLTRLHDQIVELMNADAEKNGKPSPAKSEEYEGVTGWTFGPGEYHAILNDVLVISNKVDGVKTMIDLHKKDKPRILSNVPDFAQARELAGGTHTAWGMVRLGTLRLLPQVQAALNQKSDNPVTELILGGIQDALQHTPLVAATLDVSDQGVNLRALLPHDPSTIAKTRGWYFAPAGTGAPQPLQPRGTIATLTTFRDLSGMWQAREELYNDEVVAGLSQADTQLGLYFSGRDFGTEILGELTPKLQFVFARQEFVGDQPVPTVKLPAAAMIVQMKHPDQFATPMLIAYQKVVGLVNIVGGMAGQQQLLLSTEDVQGASVSKAVYLVDPETDRQAAPLYYNASPTCAQVGDHFIIGSTTGIVRDLVAELKNPTATSASTDNTLLNLNLQELTAILNDNRETLISQNMLEEGHDRQQAESAIGLTLRLMGKLKAATLRLAPEQNRLVLEVGVELK